MFIHTLTYFLDCAPLGDFLNDLAHANRRRSMRRSIPIFPCASLLGWHTGIWKTMEIVVDHKTTAYSC